MISVNPAGLAVGTYVGSIAVSASGFTSQTVSVTLTVNPGVAGQYRNYRQSVVHHIQYHRHGIHDAGHLVSGGAALPYTVES